MPDQIDNQPVTEEQLQAFKAAYFLGAAEQDAEADRESRASAPVTAEMFLDWAKSIQRQLTVISIAVGVVLTVVLTMWWLR